MGNIILGRKLNYKQIAALKDGTKIYIKELGRFGDKFKSSVAIKEGNIVRKQGRIKHFYTINKGMGKIFDGTIDAEFYEVCVLDEMKEITFKEAKSLPEGTLVFAKEAKGYGNCYTEKKDNCLKELYKIYSYNFNNTNEYEKRGVKLYISKEVNVKTKETKQNYYSKPSTTVLAEHKGVKIGDRVKRKSDGELGTVIDFVPTKEDADEFGICYDNPVGSHCLGIGKNGNSCRNGYGKWELRKAFDIVTEQKEADKDISLPQIKTSVTGNKIEVEYDGTKAIAKCCPEDIFNTKIGLGLALERLGKQLQEVGVKERELIKYPLFSKERWVEFLNGEIVLKCRKKEDAKELLSVLHSMGYKWAAGNSLLETTYFTHDTVYEINSNKAFCPYERDTNKKIMLYK